MTAHFIAKLVESKFNNIDMGTAEGLVDYNISAGILEDYIRMPHFGGRYDKWVLLADRFLNFEITELVYRHAKDACERRIHFDNWYRNAGWVHGSKINALKLYVK